MKVFNIGKHIIWSILGTLVILFPKSAAYAQFDARLYTRLVEETSRLELLDDHLLTLTAFRTLMPFDEQAKYAVARRIGDFQNGLENILRGLPRDPQAEKLYLTVEEDWNFYQAYLQKEPLTTEDWHRLDQIRRKLAADLTKFREYLSIYTIPNERLHEQAELLHALNSEISEAFLSAVLKKKFRRLPVSAGNPVKLLEKADRNVVASEKSFPDGRANTEVKKLRTAVRTFYRGMKNHYDPVILFDSYLQASDRILRLHDEAFTQAMP